MPTAEEWIKKMSFGKNLRRFRRDRGLTQAEMARLAGIKITHMSKLENDTGDPKLSTIYKLMAALECSADSLLMDEAKLGVDGVLRATFERAEQLPRESKITIIDVLDNYCKAAGMDTMYEKEGWIRTVGKNTRVVDELAEKGADEG